jgi:hypothetical protein
LVFLGQNIAARWAFLNQPSMVRVNTGSAGAPSQTFAQHKFFDLRVETDSEGRPSKARSRTQVWASPLDHDSPGVLVPSRPELGAYKPSPDKVRRHRHFQMVSDMDSCPVGTILFRPTNQRRAVLPLRRIFHSNCTEMVELYEIGFLVGSSIKEIGGTGETLE